GTDIDCVFLDIKNAIGAIDETHISAKVPLVDQLRYRNRKGETSQNVMGCVDFDMMFRSVVVGWEGSAADMRVLRWALESGGFKVPEGKYFLVDAGYANTPQFLALYRGIRQNLAILVNFSYGLMRSYNVLVGRDTVKSTLRRLRSLMGGVSTFALNLK
ncbi:hypothetical protein Taro_046045, partial [Colocasia esculenta]|nr:hypothetical protein [Colocasia esculenta]